LTFGQSLQHHHAAKKPALPRCKQRRRPQAFFRTAAVLGLVRCSGATPVNLPDVRGMFAACSCYYRNKNGGFLPLSRAATVLTSQGSQVQSLPRPPSKVLLKQWLGRTFGS